MKKLIVSLVVFGAAAGCGQSAVDHYVDVVHKYAPNLSRTQVIREGKHFCQAEKFFHMSGAQVVHMFDGRNMTQTQYNDATEIIIATNAAFCPEVDQ